MNNEQERQFLDDIGVAIVGVVSKYYPDEYPQQHVGFAIQFAYAMFLAGWTGDDTIVKKWLDHCQEFGKRHFTNA